MYKVLVVDDEQWIRKWLVKIIPTLRDDVEVVNAFDNGESALNEIISTKIDIVVSDIRMPILGGLDLINEIKKKNLPTKFILVSGYEEFEYAKKAIKFGVEDYLLKPIEKDELSSAFSKTISKIESEKISESNPELVHSAIYKILRSFVLEKDISELKEIKSICINNDILYNHIMIGMLQPNTIIQSSNIIKETLLNVLNKRFPNDLKFVILEDSLNFFVLILHKGSVDGFSLVLDSIKRELENKNNEKLAKVEFSPWFNEIESLPHYFEECRKNLKNTLDSEASKNNIEKENLVEIRTKLIKYIEAQDVSSASSYINYLKLQDLSSKVTIDDFRLMVFSLISDIIKILEKVDDSNRGTIITQGYDFCIKIYNYSNFNAILDWVSHYLNEVILYLSQNDIFSVTQIVKQVYKQMQNEYGSDLNLSYICDKYKINSSYFSKKFKEEIGENFVDSLTTIRIDEAKRLLINTQKPIKEIALIVGFNDAKYFSKVFTLKNSMSPSTFRHKSRV